MTRTGNLTEADATRLFFNDPMLWPHIYLPNKRRVPKGMPDTALMLNSNDGTAVVIFNCTMFDHDLSSKPKTTVLVANLIREGWVVD